MTREAISDLIARGEGSTMEFKRSLGRELGRELCAFANADGGTILIGVSGRRGDGGSRRSQPVEVESAEYCSISGSGNRGGGRERGRYLAGGSAGPGGANPTPSVGASSCARGRAVSRCRMRRLKTCSTRSDASTSTRLRATSSPWRTISTRRSGRSSVAAPRSRKRWTESWPCGTWVLWTGRIA